MEIISNTTTSKETQKRQHEFTTKKNQTKGDLLIILKQIKSFTKRSRA